MNNELLARFLESRGSLSLDEMDLLLADIWATPEDARRVRELLIVDDLLGRALGRDRNSFERDLLSRVRPVR